MAVDKNYELLSSIASGGPTEVDTEAVLGQYWVDRSEQVLEQTKHMEPVERSLVWSREMEDWDGWAVNKENYWKTKYSLSPLPDEEAKAQHSKSEVESLLKLRDEEKEYYFRDNAHKWPDHIFKNLEPLFFDTKQKITQKEIERSRITQSLEVGNLLDALDLSRISPDISLDSHVESFLKAYGNGYTEISVNEQGQLAVPDKGKYGMASLLPDIKNPTDLIILKNDIKPTIVKKFKSLLDSERKAVVDSEKQTIKSLFNNLESSSIQKVHKTSIIVDHAITNSGNPIEGSRTLSLGIERVMRNEIKQGKYQSFKELVNGLRSYQTETQNTLKERLGYGRA